MATRQFKLRGLAVVIGCASLLPIACSGDDDSGNPTPPGSGGTGAKGGTGGSAAKGGSSGNAGSPEGGATTGGTDASGGTGGTHASGGKGGSGAKGGSGGTGAEAGTNAEGGGGNIGGAEAGSGGTSGTGPQQHDCTDDDLSTFNCGTTAHPVNIECYADCNPTQTDDAAQFLNRCPDGSGTLGGVKSACSPWTATLTKLGAGCKALGTGCTLPALP